ncbi:hypothetical protein LTR17_022300 [Elasticomyces elasticus]|nr:hypothetical protein LTR17_022300 [Elasticomyces elasticus]
MRLLKRDTTGGVTFTKDIPESELPQFEYAILSHTWGPDEEEVSYEDVRNGNGTSKARLGVGEDTFLSPVMHLPDLATDLDVTALVKELDGLPLALATTGAYLEQASVSVATYLRLYKASSSRLHEDDAGLETYEHRTLYSTWRISLERIQQQNELSAKVLHLWCYFSNQDLCIYRVGDSIHNIAGLLHEQNNMHGAEEMYLRALRGKEEAWGPKHTSTLDTVSNLANFYSNQGRMKEAEEMYLRALRGKEDAWGPKHTSTLDTGFNLGIFYSDQGRMQEAEEMFAWALEGYQNVEGDHEADIEYLQEQLETLRAGRQASSQHLQSDSRNLRADISSDVVG